MRRIVETLSGGEPAWLRSFRMEHLQTFQQLPWESGKYANLAVSDGMLSSVSIDGFHVTCREKGIGMLDIFSAVAAHPELRPYFVAAGTKGLALQNAFMSGGFFLRVPADAKAVVPLDLLFRANACARNIIVAGENSELVLVQRISSDAAFAALQADIHAREGAHVRLATLQDMSVGTTALMNQRAFLEKNARLEWTTGTLGAGTMRSTRDIVLNGKGADASDLEVLFGSGSQQFELCTNMLHNVPDTKGYSTTKGVLGGSARALTQGMARIEKSAPGSDSYLAEHMMLISPQAKAEPMPFMEIDTNDVKAKHSGFVSRMDEEKVFYLKARGIRERDARKMIVLGFLQTSMAQAGLIRDELRGKIERKWEDA